MLTDEGPRVLEFNCRFGDPETQAVVPLLEDDLLGVLAAAAQGDLQGRTLDASDQAAVTVALAAAGYPAEGDTGSPIEGIDDAERDGALVFHAGTAMRGGRLVTNGGRILSVTAKGDTVTEAREAAYAAVARIDFAGARYRRDVAAERGQRVGR
jgi:phosphoribosylamine--glycine ligase